jgi:hypothetical protein
VLIARTGAVGVDVYAFHRYIMHQAADYGNRSKTGLRGIVIPAVTQWNANAIRPYGIIPTFAWYPLDFASDFFGDT